MPAPCILVWLRNDLRVTDNTALHSAAASGLPVVPVFVLDDDTPGRWRLGGAARWWLAQSLRSHARQLEALGSRLVVRRGRALDVIPALARETGAVAVHCSRNYEPWAPALEAALKAELARSSIEFKRYRGVLLFEPERISTRQGDPYRIYTPFARAIIAAGDPGQPLPAPERLVPPAEWPRSLSIDELRLEPSQPDWADGLRAAWIPGEPAASARLDEFLEHGAAQYAEERNRPDRAGTSRLSPHLRHGEISIRTCWHRARLLAERRPDIAAGILSFQSELLWREFSQHLLFNVPSIAEEPFRREFADFPWEEDAGLLVRWQKGRTGYPIVDAGMRELWTTGWMHNRVRMVTASFLVKHLLQPWQNGEEWFWDTLVDADLASNAMNWQWVAGSGTDAAPYFRIFNPTKQGVTYDPAGDYVRRWCPELARLPAAHIHDPWLAEEATLSAAGVVLGETYPRPLISHVEARHRALSAYGAMKHHRGTIDQTRSEPE